ncbi:MAG: efflux RND transporter periplasmic adaptor subunit [Devosia sp.]
MTAELSSARPAATLRRRRPFPLWRTLLGLVVVAAAAWVGVTRPWEVEPLTVVIEVAKAGPAERVLAINGRIVPDMQVDLSPTVSGRLETVRAEEGDLVKAGDVLATLDDAQQRAAVKQTAAALEGARATLQQAKINFERAKSLGDAISRRDLDAAQLAVETAENDVDRLTAVETQALSLLSQYSVKAPFDGTVLIRGADPGQVVNSSTVLFQIADLAHLRAEASIDELYSAEIHRGLKARLQPSGYNRILEGEVSFVSPSVDSSTGGRLVRVRIIDAKGLVLPIGLTANLNVVVATEASTITVPRNAIVDAASAPAVFVVESGKAVRRPVEFIDWPSARLIVTSGLEDGDAVIIEPKAVTDGAIVAPKAG